jgi:hypothetical protein
MDERLDEEMTPGDEVPPGAAPAGVNVCPDCGGDGKLDGKPCEACGGEGTVREAVGGG